MTETSNSGGKREYARTNTGGMRLILPLEWQALFPLGCEPGLTVKHHYEPVALQFVTVGASKYRLCFQDL